MKAMDLTNIHPNKAMDAMFYTGTCIRYDTDSRIRRFSKIHGYRFVMDMENNNIL